MLKHYKRILKGEPKHRQESPSHPIESTDSQQSALDPAPAGAPPTEAAVAANKGYSDNGLASKVREHKHVSPKIAAGPVQALPQEASPEADPSASSPSLPSPVAYTSAAKAPAPSPSTPATSSAPDPPYRHSPVEHPQHTSPQVTRLPQHTSLLHVEESGASCTSSTGSVSRPKGDHKAALHSANERLKKALQNAAKPAPKAAAHVQLPVSASSSPETSPSLPAASREAVLQSPAAADSQQNQQHKVDANGSSGGKGLSHLRSEASVMSAESDDDADDLTGVPPLDSYMHVCVIDCQETAQFGHSKCLDTIDGRHSSCCLLISWPRTDIRTLRQAVHAHRHAFTYSYICACMQCTSMNL